MGIQWETLSPQNRCGSQLPGPLTEGYAPWQTFPPPFLLQWTWELLGLESHPETPILGLSRSISPSVMVVRPNLPLACVWRVGTCVYLCVCVCVLWAYVYCYASVWMWVCLVLLFLCSMYECAHHAWELSLIVMFWCLQVAVSGSWHHTVLGVLSLHVMCMLFVYKFKFQNVQIRMSQSRLTVGTIH